jgi:O-antigen/teichoic acid export membrane protein
LSVFTVQASAIAYLVPFAIIAVVECVVNQISVRAELRRTRVTGAERIVGTHVGNGSRRQASSKSAEFIWLAVVAALVLLSSQLDRLLLAITLPAEAYGRFFLMSTFTLSLLSLQMPIQRAFFPSIMTSGERDRAATRMLGVVICMICIPCVVLACAPSLVLQLWLRTDPFPPQEVEAFRLMLLGVAMVSLYSPMSALLLSAHKYAVMITVSAAALLTQLIVLGTFISAWGSVAAGLAWLAWGAINTLAAVMLWRRIRTRPAPVSRAI